MFLYNLMSSSKKDEIKKINNKTFIDLLFDVFPRKMYKFNDNENL